MNPIDFRDLIKMGDTNDFTISVHNQELTHQKLQILISEKNTFFIHSDDFNQTLDRDRWMLSGDPNNIELTNIANKDKIKFHREL